MKLRPQNVLLPAMTLISVLIAGFAHAQTTPLPAGATGPTGAPAAAITPAPTAAPAAPGFAMPPPPPGPKGPAGPVDQVLERISKNMTPPADLVDAQAETSINREVNLSRSTGQMLRPVGFLQVGEHRVIFATEDGKQVLRLKEGSRIGLMKIVQITEYGVEYTVSGKTMFAPLAYTATDAPKAPQQNAATGAAQAPAAQQAAASPVR